MERLVIAWSPERTECDWLLLDRNGNRRGPVTRAAALDALPVAGKEREVVWILPGVHTLASATSLPLKGREKILRALPYALEERFAQDPERLFFALAPGAAGGLTQSVALEREWLTDALSILGEHDLAPTRVLPDYLALPWAPGTWTVLADAGMLYVRESHGLGFALEAEIGWTVLKRRFEALPEDQRPASIRFIRGREPYGPLADLPTLQPETEPRPEGLLGTVPEGLTQSASLNLLQGPFSQRRTWKPLLRPWLPALGALGIVILLAFGGFLTSWISAAHANDMLRSRIHTRFQQLLPGARWIEESTVRDQIRDRLQKGAAGRPGQGLFPLLLALTNANTTGVRLESLSYQAGSLQVQVRVPDVSTLDKFQTAIRGPGVTAKIRSANQTKSGVDGALLISSGAGSP